MKHATKATMKRGGKFVAQAILATLFIGGVMVTGAIAPNLFGAIEKLLRLRDVDWIDDRTVRTRRVLNTFNALLKRGYIKKTYRGKQLYISLTEAGRKKAKRFSFDEMRVLPQKRWDGKWRMVMFDIEEKRKLTREALRGKLKELGFYQLQKSVWIHAFPCEKELHLLEEFFELDDTRYMCFEIRGLPKFHEKTAKIMFGLAGGLGRSV